jgi:hypothetical protein
MFYRITSMELIISRFKKLKSYHILTFLGSLLALSAFILPIINPDLFWHLSAGRYIIKNFAVPQTDFLSWSMQGEPWFDFEWLVQIFYYSIFKKFSFTGLFIFKFLILSGVLYLFYKIIELYKLKKLSFIVLPLVAAALITNSDLRPENFTILFFTALILVLERARLNIIDLRKPSFYLKLFFFFVLWVNLHAGYVYGSVFVFFYWFGELFEEALPWIYGREKRIKIAKSKYYLAAFALSFLASFINPYGYKIFSVMANHHKYLGVLQEYINEWQPFDLTNIYQWPYIIIFICSFMAILYKFIKSKDIPYIHIISMLFFAYSSSNYARHSPFFTIVAITFLLSSISNVNFKNFKRGYKWLMGILAITLLLSFYALFVWSQYGGIVSLNNSSDSAISFLKKNSSKLKDLKMFNYWGWGGYLGFNLYPDYKTFIDGRYIFHSFLEETENCRINLETWNKFLAKYNFDMIILERESMKIMIKHKKKKGRELILGRPAYLLYLPKKDWAVTHWDKKLVILLRRKAVDASWLKEHEYKLLRPEDTENLAVMAIEGDIKFNAIEKEVELYLKNNDASLKDSLNENIKQWWKNLSRFDKAKEYK